MKPKRIVQKFGGTSLSDVVRIKRAASRVAQKNKEGCELVVVVSALGQTTDELINLAHQITPEPSEREYDTLLSTGEIVSMALMAMTLQSMRLKAISLSGPQVKIKTNSIHTKARILSIDTERIEKELEEGKIVVVAGFQGVDEMGDTTTLGRGGSDLTAVALAGSLKADLCEIFTDVAGVFTADPRIVPEAKKIPVISYDELLELASLGAQVMQPRSLTVAKKFNVPLHIRSSFSMEEGTIVTKEVKAMEDIVVSGVSLDEKDAKITLIGVPDKPGIAAKIFEEIAKQEINIDIIIQNVSSQGLSDISFTVVKSDLSKALSVVKKVMRKIGAKGIEADENIAKVSVVGVGMRSHSGVAAKMFKALAQAGINIEMISTSEIKVSCIISAKHGKKALRTIHKAFELDKLTFSALK